MAIHTRSLYYASGLNESAGEWLLSKLNSAVETIQAARDALDKLNQLLNPYSSSGGRYTDDFFQQQWDDERAYHLETTRSYQVKQKKELGRLLYLEEQLEKEWKAVPVVQISKFPKLISVSISFLNRSREGLSAAQGIARANVVLRLNDQIEAQRARVGEDVMVENLTRPQRDKLLKIWYLKTDLRRKFLALIEEKRPLVRVCRPGEATTLGTDGQQKLIESVRNRANALRKILNRYNKQVSTFVDSYPDHPHPRTLEYTELLNLESEDAFWNDGLFTNQNEPWAVDQTTQDGIRHLAALNRGNEEQRRVGWEMRRAMRWAVNWHEKLLGLSEQMETCSRTEDEWNILISDPTLRTLCEHPILQSLDRPKRIMAARSLIHSEMIKVFQLQRAWNRTCSTVFNGTTGQLGDSSLYQKWIQQVDHVENGSYSIIDGDPKNQAVNLHTGTHHQTSPLEADNDREEEELDDDGHLDDISHIVHQTMMDQLANETRDGDRGGNSNDIEE
ncbi:hypothetical protein PGTUg99_023669 [Puccinia graminis f. sp. tritici]|nr:hypothetical protein PGTUg99_023669 [Puccinia graminis f. sp. tritici]